MGGDDLFGLKWDRLRFLNAEELEKLVEEKIDKRFYPEAAE